MKKNILFGLMLLALVAATQVLRAMNHAEETEETPGKPQRILLIGDSMLDGLEDADADEGAPEVEVVEVQAGE